MKFRPRKVGGYLILSGLFGGWFGMMTYDKGFQNALLVTAIVFAVMGLLTLASYLMME